MSSTGAGATVASALGHIVDSKKVQQLANPGTTVRIPEDGVYHTSLTGVKISDTDTWLRSGERGPANLEDFHGHQKISHFDHERIPERVVHARGTAAHGIFQLHTPIPEFSSAPVLNDTSLQTSTFVRFSTVLGSAGSADSVRDVRGFAVRFYTNEGLWDIVGNSIPVFFIQDGMKFPDLIHAGKPEPNNAIPQAQTAHDNFWDFISLVPESTHMIAWLLSDRTIPRSYRHMQGFGVNTYCLINKEGKRSFVKFHWTPHQGIHSLVWDEALKLAGQDPDYHRRDLYDSIEAKGYPKWELGVQIVPEEDEHKFDFDLLDCTKLIPEELVPIKNIGTLTLNKNPTDYFAETEQVAFCTQNIIPGIDYSLDPMLQIRNFSYFDTQLSRLGTVNFHQIPINRPICPVLSTLRDGGGQHQIPTGPNYWPNSKGNLPKPASAAEGGFVHHPTAVEGVRARQRGPKFAEHTAQATLFWNSLSEVEREHVINTASFELGKVKDRTIQERMMMRFNEIHNDLATCVAANFDIPIHPIPGKIYHNRTTDISQITGKNTFTAVGRRVGIFAFDGFSSVQVNSLKLGLASIGVIVNVISAKMGPVYPSGTNPAVGDMSSLPMGALMPDFTIETCRSTFFDALFWPDGDEFYQKNLKQGRVIHFAREAFAHFKPIAAAGCAVPWIMHICLPGQTDIKASQSGDYTSLNGVVLAPNLTDEESGALATMKQLKKTTTFGSAFVDAIAGHRHWNRDVSMVAF